MDFLEDVTFCRRIRYVGTVMNVIRVISFSFLLYGLSYRGLCPRLVAYPL